MDKYEIEYHKERIIHRARDARPKEFGIGDEIALIARKTVDTVAGGISKVLGGGEGEEYGYCEYRRQYLEDQGEILQSAWDMFNEHKEIFSKNDKHEIWEYLTLVKEELRTETRELEKRCRHMQWRQRKEGHLARWKETVDRLEGRLERVQANLAKNQAELDDAWSDNYIARLEGFIEQDEAIIDDLENRIAELREKIESVEDEINSSDYDDW